MARISILLPSLHGGGAERVNIDLAQEFVRAGHDVDLVLMQAKGPLLEEAKASFRIVDLGAPRVRDLPRALVRYLRNRRPDALLAAMWPLTVIAPLAQRVSGHSCKVLVSEHNMLSVQYNDRGRLHRAAMRASMAIGYRLADRRVGVSSGVVQDIAALSGLRPYAAIDVIHNPIPARADPPVAAMRDAEAFWSCPAGARIVTVGSMKAQKNHPLLLRAFARLDCPDARLMFVGDGAGRDTLVSLSRELSVSERVIFAGFRLDPTPFYKTADLFVLSSDYEGFGNVLVEAMAAGLPVVTTDCLSGPSEILNGGQLGRLVPVGNAVALAEAMTGALNEPGDPAPRRDRAADFAPGRIAAQYLEILLPPPAQGGRRLER